MRHTGWLLLCVLAVVSCQKKSSGTSGSASAQASPTDLSFIVPSQSITLTFSDAMDKTSVSVGGTLGSEAASATWSSTTVMTLVPMTAWTKGADRTLTLSGKSSDGKTASASFTYDVVSCDKYVSPSGSDSNPGSSGSPKLTISAGISATTAPGTVCVAEGSYMVSSSIAISSGISVYGGFKTGSWTVNDPKTYISAVTDTRSSGGTSTTPNAVFFASGNKSSAVLGGFTANAGGGNFSAGFSTSNAYTLTVKGNTLNGGSGGASHGAFLYNDAVNTLVLKNNTLNGGTGATTYGAYVYLSSAALQSNTITAGNSATNYGVYLNLATSGSISSNVIQGGAGTHSYGLYCNIVSSPITSNTIKGGSGSADSYGVYNGGLSGPYPTLTSNKIEGGSGALSYGVYEIAQTGTYDRNWIHGGSGSTSAIAMFFNDSDASVRNNLIYGGDSSDESYGVYLTNPGNAILRNNTIDGGKGGVGGGVTNRSAAILIHAADKPKFENNILFTTGGTNRYGIYVDALIVGSVLTIHNNVFFEAPSSVMYDAYSHCTGNHDGDGNTKTCDVTDLNGVYTSSANIAATPVFTSLTGTDGNASTYADNDWSLSSSTSAGIKTGGLDGSANGWGFTVDYSGTTRTASAGTGWSMGAYERD